MIPALFARLCDDAAVFPPGRMPLRDAVPAHLRHRKARYGGLVGPLVVPADALSELRTLLDPADRLDHAERLDLAVTLPAWPRLVPSVLAGFAALPVRLDALEVAMPEAYETVKVFAALERTLDACPNTAVFVEIPRDDRVGDSIAECARHGYRAKLRTGGMSADLYPGEAELAGRITALVDAGVPFKATAGLHHGVRNTDLATGFEQHGFLNLLLAVDAALRGAGAQALATVLAERDAGTIARRIAGLDGDAVAAVRARFLSFGTCSIREPVEDLVELGLVRVGAGVPR
ncbi:hypothetical protein [Actinopolymorpha sp. B9G3]|uniref:hypothetical protein n=1 Tax=Actinopolymorpha sp. B9G3 TaxID=3158970 RepID=UPI0032D98561